MYSLHPCPGVFFKQILLVFAAGRNKIQCQTMRQNFTEKDA